MVEVALAVRHLVVLYAVHLVRHVYLHLVQPVVVVELGQDEVGHAVDPLRVPAHHQVEPADPARAAGGRAVLVGLALDGDQQVGVRIVQRAIEEPLRCIAANAGHEPAIVVERVKGMKGAMGFNAQSEVYEDLVDAGVIDPTKVVRVALQNAASVASMLLTSEAAISSIPGTND